MNTRPVVPGRIIIVVILLVVGLGPKVAAAVPHSTHTAQVISSAAPNIPAPPVGGPRPTLAVSPAHGHAGQTIVVTGQGVAPYRGVRVVWISDAATLTAGVVDVSATQDFHAELEIPADLAPGPSQVCAAVTGEALAEFACVAFAVDAPPPGAVDGHLPFALAADDTQQATADKAFMALVNRVGNIVAQTPVEADGSFSIDQVPPGFYQAIITGTVPAIVAPSEVQVRPMQVAQVEPSFLTAGPCGRVQAEVMTVYEWADGALDRSRRGLLDQFNRRLGTYVSLGASSTPHNATFEAGDIQAVSGDPVTGMRFSLETAPGHWEKFTDTQPPYQLVYNVNSLSPGSHRLEMTPLIASGPTCTSSTQWTVEVVANPLTDPDNLLRDEYFRWSDADDAYVFGGTFPQTGFLPVTFPDPPPTVPLLGKLENRLDAGLQYEGKLKTSGEVTLRVVKFQVGARLFSYDVLNKNQDLLPGLGVTSTVFQNGFDRLEFPIATNTKLGSLEYSTTVYRGPVASFWGIVTVNVSVGVGLQGSVTLIQATLRPLAPEVSAEVYADVGPKLNIDFWLDLLLGVASVGARVTPAAALRLPLYFDTASHPAVELRDPCLVLQVMLNVWARVGWGWFSKKWDVGDYRLVNYEKCLSSAAAPETALAQQPAPRLMASPSAASGPDGRMLSVYIDDATPGSPNPTPKVMARFWNVQAKTWASATALTDGLLAVQDPVAAFVGESGQALVVWTENPMTEAEYQAAGDNLGVVLARQEISYAFWNGATWGPAQRLTSDTVADGRAAIAGDEFGATLAWVRDIDGNAATRQDWRIAVTQWDAAAKTWMAIDLLDARPAPSGSVSLHKLPATGESLDRQFALNSGAIAELHVCPTCPYTNIQSAVDAANPGDTIKIAAGTYTGVQTRGGVSQLVQISKAITILGGYTTANWATANPDANPTILDAQGKGRVIYITGSISPTIAGLRLTNGNAAGLMGAPWPGDAGGGVYIITATATLSRNWIYDNTADYGGGVYLYNSAAILNANSVTSNTAQHSGGGLHLYASPAMVTGNRIDANTAPVWGGGAYLYSSAATLSGNTITANTSDYGGGLCLSSSNAALLIDNTLSSNLARQNGGGVYLYYSAATLSTNKVIANTGGWGGGINLWYSPATLNGNAVISNTAQYDGGGFSLYHSNAILTNNIVARNQSNRNGTGLYIWASAPRLIHTTVTRNAGGDGSGVYVANEGTTASSVTLTNTILVSHSVGLRITGGNEVAVNGILWFDTPLTIAQAPTATVSVQNPQQGDPALAADGFHLTTASLALDRGVDAGVASDIDGDTRPQLAGFDLGADELAGWMNAQVSVARIPYWGNTSISALVWTADHDGQLTTVSDRHLVLAQTSIYSPGRWEITSPSELPAGAGSASVSLIMQPEIPMGQIAFLVHGADADGLTATGIGNQAVLWTATYEVFGGSIMNVEPVLDEHGQHIRAERPLLSSGSSASYETVLAFRRFGDPNTNGILGQLALSRRVLLGEFSAPLYLTNDAAQHWQPALAVDGSSGQMVVLSVRRASSLATQPFLPPASVAASPDLTMSVIAAGDDPLESATLASAPDPALDPALTLSQQHAPPGTQVAVTAILRNVGRDPAAGMTVGLYAGAPGGGTLLATAGVPSSLSFNETYAVNFAITAKTGDQPIYAQVTASGGNANTTNDIAIGAIGELPPPPLVSVAPSASYPNALQITWDGPAVEGVAGYRILRSPFPGGPYELVGEATATRFLDVQLAAGQSYYYVVQAYDAAGVRSTYSPEAGGGIALHQLFLPMIWR